MRHQVAQPREVASGETQATMRICMRSNIAFHPALPVPADILNTDGVEDSLLHEIEKFTPSRVVKEERQMREASVRVFPGRPRFAGQFCGPLSKTVRLLSQSNLEVTAAWCRAKSDHPMVLAWDSRGHGEYMPQFDFLLLWIGQREALRHKIIDGSIEINLRIVREFVLPAIIQEQTEGYSGRRLGAGPTIKRCSRHGRNAVPLSHEVALPDDHNLPRSGEQL